jgi:hypothetical protein
MDPPYRAVGFKVVTEVPDGATVAPGQDIRVRVTWDPKAWSGPDLDAALACVAVKGGLDGNLSSGERPTANDGVFEYVLHVPDNIRPGCDICVQGFLTGTGTDGNPQQVTGDRPCFMSGPPPEPPKPPVTRPPGPPATTPTTTAVPPRTPAEVPTPIEGGKAGDGSSTGTEVSGGELPRTGSLVTRLATAGGGLTLSLGGLAVIGGARRRSRRRANR